MLKRAVRIFENFLEIIYIEISLENGFFIGSHQDLRIIYRSQGFTDSWSSGLSYFQVCDFKKLLYGEDMCAIEQMLLGTSTFEIVLSLNSTKYENYGVECRSRKFEEPSILGF